MSSSSSDTNPRGIPRAQFISDVNQFMSTAKIDADEVLKRLQEQYSKYKFAENTYTQKKYSLRLKIPEIKRTLETVEFLSSRTESDPPISTHYELNDGLFAHALVEKPNSVCLWLGANVMVEYSFAEAKALLTKNLEGANTQLTQFSEDLEFLKDQITTTEVNIARVYNWDVKQRRILREKGLLEDKEKGKEVAPL
eukprot:TRINITY_DN2073_c0_g1_i1.p1 TRINITY_DN2073_c0_g1~~TRINITY_DN2073_c0_g1_i1.p1  ORF type:complete len:196 (-),score=48.46 TRINITY_DN2073_c0_g1_i1:35-622(-)